MALRRRLTLLAAGVVGLTVVLVALVSYAVLRNQLRGQVDDALTAQAALVQRVGVGGGFGDGFVRRIPAPPARFGGPASSQLIAPDGTVFRAADRQITVNVDDVDRGVAAGRRDGLLRDAHAGQTHIRLLTAPLPGGGAIQLARSLQNVDSVLANLRLVLLVLCLGGTALAAVCARLFARQVIQPVADLTAAAEHISATEDLGRRVDVPGDDEVGRLAARFNTMLATLEGSRKALDESVDAQRQLVADASHELRTPVTALRTNVEVLLAAGDLPEPDRRRLLEDVREEAEELGALITDVIELARGDVPLAGTEDVQLDMLVAEAVARAARRRAGGTFATDLQPTVVAGIPDRLGRAVDNLLDNAAKYSPDDTPVEVALHDGEVTVRDHGPGVSAADRDHIFDRFYRGEGARERPGSGLGLAIVRQVAEAHGGNVTVEDAPGGGALFRLRLPVAPP